MSDKTSLQNSPRDPVLVMFHNGRMHTPFFSTPWQIFEATPVLFEVWYRGKRELFFDAGGSSATEPPMQSAMKCIVQLDKWIARKLESGENLHLYTVHPRSIIGRFYGRLGVLAGYKFEIPLDRLIWQDLCELVNYPAILSLEERQAFSPKRLCETTLINTSDPMDVLWQTLMRFQ